MKRRYIVTRTIYVADVAKLAINIHYKGYITDWGFADKWFTRTGIRWWIEVNE